MSDATNHTTRLVPAVCTQCGAQLEVDPSQEAAICRYCGTPFIVDKAIQNYTIQHAKIEHADTVNIDMKGAADSFFGFLGTQMSERRALRREERKEERTQSREMSKAFIRIFTVMMIGMFILAAISFVIMQFRGDGGSDTPAQTEPQAVSTVEPAESSAGNTPGTSFEYEYSVNFNH